MKKNLMRAFPLALALVAALSFSSHAGELVIQPNKQNVVASRLAGIWRLDAELSKRLISDEQKLSKVDAMGQVYFQDQPEMTLEIPEKYEESLADKQIYMAGLMGFGGEEFPFILIEHDGNPHVVFFHERDGEPMGDAESFNVMLAPASDGTNDILLLGGDFNNQPFMAFQRQEGTERPQLQ